MLYYHYYYYYKTYCTSSKKLDVYISDYIYKYLSSCS